VQKAHPDGRAEWEQFATHCNSPICGGSSSHGLSITGELPQAPSVYALGAAAPRWSLLTPPPDRGWHGVALVLTGLTSRLRRDVLPPASPARAAPRRCWPRLGTRGPGHRGGAPPVRRSPEPSARAAVLPWLVRTPAELAASNAVTAVMETPGR
jgi:hypothetical protein